MLATSTPPPLLPFAALHYVATFSLHSPDCLLVTITAW
jgi:hypothetical protein